MKCIELKPIGIVHSPFKGSKGTPIHPGASEGARAEIELFPEYEEGLKDLDGFSHIVVLFHLHRSKPYKLTVIPYMDDTPRGLFATRAPSRPNPIGMSVVKLASIEGNFIYIEGLDMIDDTPVLDIKPYIPEFKSDEKVCIGWLEEKIERMPKTSADDRFEK